MTFPQLFDAASLYALANPQLTCLIITSTLALHHPVWSDIIDLPLRLGPALDEIVAQITASPTAAAPDGTRFLLDTAWSLLTWLRTFPGAGPILAADPAHGLLATLGQIHDVLIPTILIPTAQSSTAAVTTTTTTTMTKDGSQPAPAPAPALSENSGVTDPLSHKGTSGRDASAREAPASLTRTLAVLAPTLQTLVWTLLRSAFLDSEALTVAREAFGVSPDAHVVAPIHHGEEGPSPGGSGARSGSGSAGPSASGSGSGVRSGSGSAGQSGSGSGSGSGVRSGVGWAGPSGRSYGVGASSSSPMSTPHPPPPPPEDASPAEWAAHRTIHASHVGLRVPWSPTERGERLVGAIQQLASTTTPAPPAPYRRLTDLLGARYDVPTALARAAAQGVTYVDDFQIDYVVAMLGLPPIATVSSVETTRWTGIVAGESHAAAATRTTSTGSPWIGTTTDTIETMERMCNNPPISDLDGLRVAAVEVGSMMEGYGLGFLAACLERYGRNAESVIHHLFEDDVDVTITQQFETSADWDAFMATVQRAEERDEGEHALGSGGGGGGPTVSSSSTTTTTTGAPSTSAARGVSTSSWSTQPLPGLPATSTATMPASWVAVYADNVAQRDAELAARRAEEEERLRRAARLAQQRALEEAHRVDRRTARWFDRGRDEASKAATLAQLRRIEAEYHDEYDDSLDDLGAAAAGRDAAANTEAEEGQRRSGGTGTGTGGRGDLSTIKGGNDGGGSSTGGPGPSGSPDPSGVGGRGRGRGRGRGPGSVWVLDGRVYNYAKAGALAMGSAAEAEAWLRHQAETIEGMPAGGNAAVFAAAQEVAAVQRAEGGAKSRYEGSDAKARQAQRRKEQNKAKIGNHHRKDRATAKAAKGMF